MAHHLLSDPSDNDSSKCKVIARIREVISRLLDGTEWNGGLKGGDFVKKASPFCVEFLVKKPFLRTYPGGQKEDRIIRVKSSWYQMHREVA